MRRRRPVLTASPPAPIDLNPRTDAPLDFRDRELDAMRPEDWAELGFLCGLEVHQQLLTRGKLFCRCPAGVRSTRVDMEVLRHMRPTLSEMGEYDGTALMEFKTRKEIVYLLDRDTVCTYEIDDTPPFPIDPEAVRIALEVAMLFGLGLASELQVMRKQYLDGSIPTGFQRTTMIGVGGVIPLAGSELGPGRELRIRQLTLEEDSCREVSDAGHRITFRTDRLGTPLVETVTEPDLVTPRDVELGGRLLARVARASGKVRRGPGAARQDVNVSIAGSRRVELKGVPRHSVLPRLVAIEAFRHLSLLRLRAEILGRGLDPADFELHPADETLDSGVVADVTGRLRSARFEPLARAIAAGGRAWAVRLPGFRGLLARPTQPGRAFAHEIEERLRVIACLTDGTFLLDDDRHADRLGQAGWRDVRSAFAADPEDAVIVLWGPEQDVETGAREALIRAADAFVGVPSETRQAHPDGTTGFERILPGPERMYPDTDTPAMPIPDEWIEEIRVRLPERPWEREHRWAAAGLDARAARVLADAPWAELFERLAPRTPECARRLAGALEHRLVAHWRASGGRELPAAERLVPLVRAVDEGSVDPDAFGRAFACLLEERDVAPEAIVARYEARADDGARLVLLLEQVAAAGLHERKGTEALLRHAMGRVMRELRGRVAPALVRERLAALLARQPVASRTEVGR